MHPWPHNSQMQMVHEAGGRAGAAKALWSRGCHTELALLCQSEQGVDAKVGSQTWLSLHPHPERREGEGWDTLCQAGDTVPVPPPAQAHPAALECHCHLPGAEQELPERTDRASCEPSRAGEMKTHFPSCRFERACAAPGSGAGISAWHFVIPTNPAQMFHIDVMINSSRGKPQEGVCLQEPLCQNMRLRRALPGCWAGWMEETLA